LEGEQHAHHRRHTRDKRSGDERPSIDIAGHDVVDGEAVIDKPHQRPGALSRRVRLMSRETVPFLLMPG